MIALFAMHIRQQLKELGYEDSTCHTILREGKMVWRLNVSNELMVN